MPLGVADVKRAGEDVTLVGDELDGARVPRGGRAARRRRDLGRGRRPAHAVAARRGRCSCESAQKTGRAIVVDEGHRSYGVTAELAAVIAERAFYHLDAPVRRLGAMDVPVPFSPPLEDETVPTPESVAAAARELCGTRLTRGDRWESAATA